MALVSNSILGDVSGKMGSKVFRSMNGKTFVSERPLHYKPAKTPAARKARSSFGMATMLSKKLITAPQLKEVWAAARIEGTDPYHRIIKHNTKNINAGALTVRNRITPDGLFLGVESVSLENEVLHLSLNCPAENNLNFPAKLYLLYYSEKAKSSLVLTQISIPESAAGGIYELDLKPAKSIVKLLKEDADALIFLALVSDMPVKKKVYWTSTYAVKIG